MPGMDRKPQQKEVIMQPVMRKQPGKKNPRDQLRGAGFKGGRNQLSPGKHIESAVSAVAMVKIVTFVLPVAGLGILSIPLIRHLRGGGTEETPSRKAVERTGKKAAEAKPIPVSAPLEEKQGEENL